MKKFLSELKHLADEYDYEIEINPLYFSVNISEEMWESEKFYIRFYRRNEIYLDVKQTQEDGKDIKNKMCVLEEFENGLDFSLISTINNVMKLMKEHDEELLECIKGCSRI